MAANVLQVIPAIAPRYGGPSAAMIGMCQALWSLNVSTLVVTTDADGEGRLDVSEGEVQDYEGIPTLFFPRQASEAYKFSRPLAGWLRHHVRDFDVVHVHAVFSHSSVAAARACLNAGIPYVLRPLGTLDPWSLNRRRWRKQLLIRFGAGRLLAGAAAMHYTTDQERRRAESGLPWLPRGAVIPLGVDETLFAGTTRTNASPYILTLCRLDPKKGVDLLIHAFHDVVSAGTAGEWRLVIAGDGDPAYVAKLREAASNGAGKSRIAFEGWVTGESRLSLLRHASLFALPSSQENFGIAVVEALACGVPAIVSPEVNLASEIEANQAGWIVPRDRTALAEGLGRAIADPAGIVERRVRARAFADRYRWSTVGEALLRLYDDILSRRAAVDRHLGAVTNEAYRAARERPEL
ncbi:MAG TPA: glycosyltransferase [Vicinamibacterales bacterium]|nr:glycosyltransferase [Vicinamibacterales bacterium]